jgi:hypothetical protein
MPTRFPFPDGKPPFIDGISTKGIHIYQLANGDYRYRVKRRTGFDTEICIYSNLAEAAASLESYRQVNGFDPPYKNDSIETTTKKAFSYT